MNYLTLRAINERPFDIASTSAKMTISEVFADRYYIYLNEFTLFAAHFNSIPNLIPEVSIDCKKANMWFFENYKSIIKDFYFDKRYFKGNK